MKDLLKEATIIAFGVWLALVVFSFFGGAVSVKDRYCDSFSRWSYIMPGFYLGCQVEPVIDWMNEPIK